MKIMVIDGNSILNRAFYGIRQLTNHEGLPTNAVYGFLATLFKLQEMCIRDSLCTYLQTMRKEAEQCVR